MTQRQEEKKSDRIRSTEGCWKRKRKKKPREEATFRGEEAMGGFSHEKGGGRADNQAGKVADRKGFGTSRPVKQTE